jgi:hypothetical protein
VVRIFKRTRSSGARELRLWFFESLDLPMLEWSGSWIQGPRPDFVRNVIRMMKLAKAEDISIYMTLLDAQVYRPDRVGVQDRERFSGLARVGSRSGKRGISGKESESRTLRQARGMRSNRRFRGSRSRSG